jgi:hypothetical protein
MLGLKRDVRATVQHQPDCAAEMRQFRHLVATVAVRLEAMIASLRAARADVPAPIADRRAALPAGSASV